MMLSLSRFRRSDIRIFEPEKTRSHSAVIAGINRRSKAIRDRDGETTTCPSQYWMRLGVFLWQWKGCTVCVIFVLNVQSSQLIVYIVIKHRICKVLMLVWLNIGYFRLASYLILILCCLECLNIFFCLWSPIFLTSNPLIIEMAFLYC